MVLSGVGDAMGYRDQQWEFSKSGPHIHEVSGGTWKEQLDYSKGVVDKMMGAGSLDQRINQDQYLMAYFIDKDNILC